MKVRRFLLIISLFFQQKIGLIQLLLDFIELLGLGLFGFVAAAKQRREADSPLGVDLVQISAQKPGHGPPLAWLGGVPHFLPLYPTAPHSRSPHPTRQPQPPPPLGRAGRAIEKARQDSRSCRASASYWGRFLRPVWAARTYRAPPDISCMRL